MKKYLIAILFLVLFLFIKNTTLAFLPGDANCDGRVDGSDYVKWLTIYGSSPQSCPNDPDFNNDNKVDGIDYVMWLQNFGAVETSTPTPTATKTPTPTATIIPTNTPTSGPTPTVPAGTVDASTMD